MSYQNWLLDVKQGMKKNKITQYEMSKILERSTTLVSLSLKNKRNFTKNHVDQISGLLGLTPVYPENVRYTKSRAAKFNSEADLMVIIDRQMSVLSKKQSQLLISWFISKYKDEIA